MSCQKGNTSRTRAQKHQNSARFRNDLYDNPAKLKALNSRQIVNVCERCKNILEWKVKYKKYKVLAAPKKCTKCEQKKITSSYHTLCLECAKQMKVCPKCGKDKEIIQPPMDKKDVPLSMDKDIQNLVKSLPERKRRTFLRFVASVSNGENSESCTKDMLLEKLESMTLNCEEANTEEIFDFDADFCDTDETATDSE